MKKQKNSTYEILYQVKNKNHFFKTNFTFNLGRFFYDQTSYTEKRNGMLVMLFKETNDFNFFGENFCHYSKNY